MRHTAAISLAVVCSWSQSCALPGRPRPSGGVPGADEVWGEARGDAPPPAGSAEVEPEELAERARAARVEGDPSRCADLAAEAVHLHDPADPGSRAALRLLEARCRLASGQAGIALRALSGAWPHLRSEVDRAWALAQAKEIALRRLGRSEAAAFFGNIPGDLATAWLGVRMALLAHERGDTAGAAERLSAVAGPLTALGAASDLARLRRRLTGQAPGGPAVGAVLPLSGPLRRVGVRALRGLMAMRSGAVMVRDSLGTAEGAVAAVAELAAHPAVVEVVGPLDRRAAGAAAAAAQAQGLALITLSVDARVTAQGDRVFRNFLDPVAEAVAVARFAVTDQGLRRLAVLRPDNGYGVRLTEAFEGAATEAGAEVVQVQVYRGAAFATAIEALLAGPAFQALFLPDTHRSVSLLAPHLAVAGLRSVGGADGDGPDLDPEGDRPVQLLGAGGWANAGLLSHGAARYLEGAVFATGWWGDAEHSEAIRFGARMVERGGEPEVFAAYAYDSAARLLRVAEVVGRDRPAVAQALTTDRWHGPVAGRGFGGDRNPAATPHLIRVRPIGFSAILRNAP